MRIKLPGFIQISYSPDGMGSGGGTEAPSGGAASAPASSPAPAAGASEPPAPSSPSGAPTTPASESPEALPDDPFSGFGQEQTDEPDLPVVETKPAAAPAKPAVVDPKAPPAAPAAPAAPQALPTPAAPAQPAAGPQEASQPQIPSPAEPQKMSQAILSNLDDFANHLAATPEFAMSPEDIEAFNSDVSTALPKFAARVYLRAQASALNQMERVVPAIIEKYMKVSKAREESSGKFYSRWPQVDRAKHGGIVDRMAQTYRKENPSASLEQMVEDLGPYVLMAAKVPHVGAAPNGSQQAQPHPASNPMARPAGNRPPQSPFVPAVGGPASPPQVSEENPWVGFGADQDE